MSEHLGPGPFIELQSVDNTNNYARGQINAGLAEDRMVIFSHEQTAGKGQRGKTWLAEKDSNIIVSMLVKPKGLPLSRQFELSACVALSVYDFFSRYAGQETKIKWPNDLYWQDRKAGGVLIENVVDAQWKWAIVGIGININQVSFPAELKNPVSLTQITGKVFNCIELAKELCSTINKNFEMLISGGFETIYAHYVFNLYKRNSAVKLRQKNIVFEATIKSVSRKGKLIIEKHGEEEYDFNEIEWILE